MRLSSHFNTQNAQQTEPPPSLPAGLEPTQRLSEVSIHDIVGAAQTTDPSKGPKVRPILRMNCCSSYSASGLSLADAFNYNPAGSASSSDCCNFGTRRQEF